MGGPLRKRPESKGKRSLGKLVPRRVTFLKRVCRMRSSQFGTMTTIGKAPDGSSRFDKMKKWHKIVSYSAYRKKFNVKIVNEIKQVCFLMHLPKNAEDMAISIYRKARVAKITNGRRFEWIAAASVYAACRVSGFNRNLDEFAAATRLHPKNIGRVYLVMKRTLHFPVDAVDPLTQVHRIALIAGIAPEVENLALKLLESQSYSGKPATLAATALYVAAVQNGSRCTQSKLAKAAGINENTLRNCYQQRKLEMAH